MNGINQQQEVFNKLFEIFGFDIFKEVSTEQINTDELEPLEPLDYPSIKI